MAVELSLKSLLISNKISLLQAWHISLALLNWLEELHAANLKQHNFHTALFLHDTQSNKTVFPGKDSPLLDAEVPTEYMAPEETGRITQTPDYRADFYRLGIVLYELFSGKPPFYHEDKLRVIWQHLADTPPPLLVNDLSPIAVQIIEKLLAKRADKRYTTVKGLRHDWEIAFNESQHNTGLETSFLPGIYDFPEKFILPPIFSIHTGALDKLFAFAGQLHNRKTKALVWVEGQPYTGKSTFLDQCNEHFATKGYRQFRTACLQSDIIPYNPIKTAFDQYAKTLHFLQGSQSAQISSRLKNSLGDNLSVLTTFAPAWESIVGKQPSAGLLDGVEIQNRLSFVLANTIATISSEAAPVVFMIDDIQNMSTQSFRLLNDIFAEPDLTELLLIVAANEKAMVHRTDSMHQEMVGTVHFQDEMQIALNPLNIQSISQILEDVRIDPTVSNDLAELIHRKSGGYPIFIRYLLNQAAQGNFFSPGNKNKWWQIDLKAFATLGTTENLLAYQQEKLNQLTPLYLEWLQLAACIGINFDIATIESVMKHESKTALAGISSDLQKMEIIVPNLFTDDFRFSNPVLHKAITQSIDERTNQQILDKILTYKLKNETDGLVDNEVFKLIGYILQLTKDDILKYKNILYDGAKRAKQIGAFDEAARYYSFLISASAQEPENIRFELYVLQMEMLIGDLQFEAYYEIKNNLPDLFTIDEIRQWNIDLIECNALLIQQKMPEVVVFAKQSLQKMGITITLDPSLLRIIFSMIKTQQGMKGRSIEELEKLPLTSDTRTKFILQLLQESSSAFFLAAPKALPEVLAIQINMALKKGISETMGVVFSTYGLNLSAFSNQFAKAEEMMTLARNLDQRFKNVKGTVVNRFLHAALTRQWHYPLKENAVLLQENYQLAREIGLIQMAFFSLATGNLFLLFSGTPFTELAPKLGKDMMACTDKQQHAMAIFLKMALQFIEDLRGNEQPMQLMEGAIFSTSVQKPIFITDNLQTNIAILLGLESLLSLVYNQHAFAKNRLSQLLQLLQTVGLSSVSLLLATVWSTISAYKLNNGENTDMRKARKKIKLWAKQAPFNFEGWLHLLEGIIYSNKNDEQLAFYHIERAIVWANGQNMLYAKALALEEKASLQFLWNPKEPTPAALIEAHTCYYYWGAAAKCRQLENKHATIRPLAQLPNPTSLDVDLASVIRASNSIAGEIKWENLLERLTTILIENAGAQTAVIILPGKETLEEIARKTGKNPVSFQIKKVDETTYPLSVFGMVKQTHQPELINNPAEKPTWALDPYLSLQKPLSVLCIPVVKNQDLLAIIYLENNLTVGAFTHERVELIKLLSGQIAISLENAQLYIDMENRVKQRTRELYEKNLEVENQKNKLLETLTELQSTQKQLIQSEKMASLGELTAGIAHEIQNPLNFINNFSEVNIELIEELEQEINDANYDEAKAIAKDIKDNEAKINRHGKRADGIVKGMLQHSRLGSGQKEVININALTEEYIRLAFHGIRASNKSFNAKLIQQFDPTIEPIRIIPQDMGRVLLNLLTNAMYATHQKKMHTNVNFDPIITIKTARIDEPNGTNIQIIISDNGGGIPKNILDKIFQPFFTTKPSGEGTGLGLSLSYDIVKAHGGEIKVDTHEGEGTTFTIQLPAN